MKKFLYAIICLLSFRVQAQNLATTSLSGKLAAQAETKIMIAGPGHFKRETEVDKAGRFAVSFSSEAGYYNVARHLVYLEPGDNVTMIKKDSLYDFQGKGSKENNLLSRLDGVLYEHLPFDKQDLANVYFMEPDDFYQHLNEYRIAANQILDNQDFRKYFKETQRLRIDYRIRFLENEYLTNYGIDQEKKKQEIALMKGPQPKESREEWVAKMMAANAAFRTKRLSLDQRTALSAKIWEGFDINNENLYKFSSEYSRLLEAKIALLLKAKLVQEPFLASKNQNEVKRDIIQHEITNNYIKESLLFQYTVTLLKSGKEKDLYYNDYIHVAQDSVFRKEATKIYELEKLLRLGADSPGFKLADTESHLITLNDLLGKFIYIDLWATWCGPCLAEMPFLKELQTKYSGSNITFVGISIDKLGDSKKWREYIIKNQLGGIQLIAEDAWNSDFMIKYGVVTIPRFILINPEGKIVSADADRPSTSKLRVMLDSLLRKN